jgi:uncharacterized membrane protein YkvA (DUF1232 family)
MAGNDVVLYEPRGLAAFERLVRRRFASALSARIAALPFAELAVAAYFCAIDGRTPAAVKLGLLGAVAVLVTPARLLPKLLARLGVAGDALGILTAVQAFGSHITPEHRLRARELLIRLRRDLSG